MCDPTPEQLEDWDFRSTVSRQIRERLLSTDAGAAFVEQACNDYDNGWSADLHLALSEFLRTHFPDDADVVSLDRVVQLIGADADSENAADFYSEIFTAECEEEQEAGDDGPEVVIDDGDDALLFDADPAPLPVAPVPVITVADLQAREADAISRVQSVLAFSADVAELLLIECNWNESTVCEKGVESRAAFLSQVGLTPAQASLPAGLRSPPASGPFSCAICFGDFPAGQMLGLPCGHFFCADCWRDYLAARRSRSPVRPCPDGDCQCRLLVSDVRLLLGDAAGAEFAGVVAQMHIEATLTLRRCTRPACELILTQQAIGRCSVAQCACGQRTCWRCREPAHAPLSCAGVERWRILTENESMQARWLCENTKPCPRCNRRIEKNGGCNHMICRTNNGDGCRFEFCWVCGHEWHTHVGDAYKCNKFVDFDASRPAERDCDFKRLNHYHTRYVNHVQSQRAEIANREHWRQTMMAAWAKIDDDQFRGRERAPVVIALVFEAIDTARSILIWSYPHAYYMAPGSAPLGLFEYVQTNVERYLEELTDLVEHFTCLSPLQFERTARLLHDNSDVLNKHVDDSSL